MNEQQRLLLVIALSIAIISGWQWMMSKRYPQGEFANTPQVTRSEDRPEVAKVPSLEVSTPKSAEAAIGNPPLKVEIEEESFAFTTDVLRGEITNKGVAFKSLDLVNYRERLAEEGEVEENPTPQNVSLLVGKEVGEAWQGRLHWVLGGVTEPDFKGESSESGKLTFNSLNTSDLSAAVEILPRKTDYAVDYRVRIVNDGQVALPVSLNVELGVVEEEIGGFGASAQGSQGLCAFEEDIERQGTGDVDEEPFVAPLPAKWSGIDKQYFVLAVLGTDEAKPLKGSCTISAAGALLRVNQGIVSKTLEGGESWEGLFTIYAGPKRDEQLSAVSSGLPEIVDYDFVGIPLGFLARPMVHMLNLFHRFTLSWGLAIMLLTLSVKALLFPVTYKSIVSMRRMQLLKPQLDKIKEQWPEDRERQQMEQLKLFKEKGVNPLGGCLPMLLQMPVWVTLYRMLWSSVDLYQQPFLWLVDLTAKEPFPLLAIGLGILTFVQQKVTPTATDSQQAKMMMILMPIMLTFFMLALPSGLVLYIFVNSVLTIIQTVAINRRQPAL